jgi:hypothetical protein
MERRLLREEDALSTQAATLAALRKAAKAFEQKQASDQPREKQEKSKSTDKYSRLLQNRSSKGSKGKPESSSSEEEDRPAADTFKKPDKPAPKAKSQQKKTIPVDTAVVESDTDAYEQSEKDHYKIIRGMLGRSRSTSTDRKFMINDVPE